QRTSTQLSDQNPNKPSLILQPNWSQIYRGEKITLRCEIQGGTQWTYEWRPTNRNSPTSSEYRINSATNADSGEYSCRGNRGRFSSTPWSNVVKITVWKLFPVHPVTEGDPVTLRCRNKDQHLLSNVFFYHNDKLIHNDSREELNISAVSKSDEGFYKCQHSGKDSPRSWMSKMSYNLQIKHISTLLFLVSSNFYHFSHCWNRSHYFHYSPGLVVVLQTIQR
uniref:Ig-like domain-containing protein n=1 Tax=Poecilia reticulata TaxID=8081 RepID=A0A3P9MZP7_POERE